MSFVKNQTFKDNYLSNAGVQLRTGGGGYTKQSYKKGALNSNKILSAPFLFSQNTIETKKLAKSLHSPSSFRGNKTSVISRKTPPDVQKISLQRELLYNMRFKAGDLLQNRTRNCGSYLSYNLDSHVTIRRTEHGHNFTGLETCGSIHNCPVCSMKIRKRRQTEIQELLSISQTRLNHSHGFLTLTAQHTKDESLETVANRLKAVWRKIQQSQKYQRFNIDAITSVEVTYSIVNGWHPHLHIVFSAPGCHLKLENFVKNFIITKYLGLINEDRNEDNLTTRRNQVYKPMYNKNDLAEYITKWDISLELTHSSSKFESKGMKPFDMLINLVVDDKKRNLTGEDRVLFEYKFEEYSKYFTGTKIINVSKGFKKLKDIDTSPEQDKLICDESIEGETVLNISKDCFRAISWHRQQAIVLNNFISSGIESVQNRLAKFNISTIYDPDTNLLDLYDPPPPTNYNNSLPLYTQAYLWN